MHASLNRRGVYLAIHTSLLTLYKETCTWPVARKGPSVTASMLSCYGSPSSIWRALALVSHHGDAKRVGTLSKLHALLTWPRDRHLASFLSYRCRDPTAVAHDRIHRRDERVSASRATERALSHQCSKRTGLSSEGNPAAVLEGP